MVSRGPLLGADQPWLLSRLLFRAARAASGLCLDVEGGPGVAEWDMTRLWDCQFGEVNSDQVFEVGLEVSGMCLDLWSYTVEDGLAVILCRCEVYKVHMGWTQGQVWPFEPAGPDDSTGFLTNILSPSRCLTVWNAPTFGQALHSKYASATSMELPTSRKRNFGSS